MIHREKIEEHTTLRQKLREGPPSESAETPPRLAGPLSPLNPFPLGYIPLAEAQTHNTEGRENKARLQLHTAIKTPDERVQ